MDLTTLLIIILLVVVLGGGGYYGRRGWFQTPHLPIRYRKFPRLRGPTFASMDPYLFAMRCGR